MCQWRGIDTTTSRLPQAPQTGYEEQTGRTHIATHQIRHWFEFQFSPTAPQGLCGSERGSDSPASRGSMQTGCVWVQGDRRVQKFACGSSPYCHVSISGGLAKLTQGKKHPNNRRSRLWFFLFPQKPPHIC